MTSQTTDLPVWVGTDELAKHLSMARRQLFELKANGTLLAGDHWRANGNGTRRTRLVWDVRAVDLTLRDRARLREVG